MLSIGYPQTLHAWNSHFEPGSFLGGNLFNIAEDESWQVGDGSNFLQSIYDLLKSSYPRLQRPPANNSSPTHAALKAACIGSRSSI